MESFTVRRAQVHDAADLAQLRAAMFDEIHSTPSNTKEPAAIYESYLRRALADESFVAFVADHDGRIVATTGLVFHRNPPTPDNPTGPKLMS